MTKNIADKSATQETTVPVEESASQAPEVVETSTAPATEAPATNAPAKKALRVLAKSDLPQSELEVSKDNNLNGKPLKPGDTFRYTFNLSCSDIETGCVNAVFTDVLPADLILDKKSLPSSNDHRDVTYDEATRTLTIKYLQKLDNPLNTVGQEAGSSENFSISMKLSEDTQLANGHPIVNVVDGTADNAEPKTDNTTVIVEIPVKVTPVASKKWHDGSSVAGSDEESTVTLGVHNGSSTSAKVTELSIKDESVAAFENFNLSGVELTKFPQGADQAQLKVKVMKDGVATWVAGAVVSATGTLAMPAGVDAADVIGVDVVFSNAAGTVLPVTGAEAGGTIELGMTLRDNERTSGNEIAKEQRVTVNNCATPSAAEGEVAAVDGSNACSSTTIVPSTVTLQAGKTFYADENGNFKTDTGEHAVLGKDSGVSANLTLKNTSDVPLKTMVITEPSTDPTSEFAKLDLSKFQLVYPEGATAATVVVTYDDGSTAPFAPANGATTGIAVDGKRVTSIVTTYTGADESGNATIKPGATAGINVHGNLNDKVDASDVGSTADVGVVNCFNGTADAGRGDGTGAAAAAACATVKVEDPRNSTAGVKTPGQTSVPEGQPITFALNVKNNGNTSLPDVVITDPGFVGGVPAANNPFDILRITGASISGMKPEEVKIEIYIPGNTPEWIAFAGATEPQREAARGIRATALVALKPTQQFTLNLVTQRRENIDDDIAITNCFSTSVGGSNSGSPSCSPTITTGPKDTGASMDKSIAPATLPEYVPGLPRQEATVSWVIQNTGNMSAKSLQLIDNDKDFFNQVDVVDFNNKVKAKFPVGANRVQIDVWDGTAWINGAPATAAKLPAGVTDIQVRGIRTTFTNVDGSAAITPCTVTATCGGTISFAISPRQHPLDNPTGTIDKTLLNTLDGKYVTEANESGNPGGPGDIPDVDASLGLVDGKPSLAVDKSTDQYVSPGDKVTFDLKVTNSGTANIEHLIVRDLLPAKMTFVEDFEGDEGQPFKVKSANLPVGTPAVPVPVFDTVSNGDHVSELKWDFGDDWVLAPGASVIITIQVKLAPGVVTDEKVVNTMGATSSSKDFVCKDGADDSGDFGEGTYCSDDASLTVKSGAAFDARKWVKGNDDLGWYNTRTGLNVPVGDATCASTTGIDGSKYTAFPCIALVNPGDQYNYLVRVVNAGTESGKAMRIIDQLPMVGDSAVVGAKDRGTQWDNRPTLASEPKLNSKSDGVTLTSLYTNEKDPNAVCAKDLDQKKGAAGCAAGDWTADYSAAATAIQWRLAFDPFMKPGEAIEITFDMDTPMDVAEISSPTIAWNSFGHSEVTDLDGGDNVLPAIEPIKVGVALSYGKLTLEKAIGENPFDLALDDKSYEFQLTCTVQPIGADAPREVVNKQIEVSANNPVTVIGLPAGAACEVYETNPGDSEASHTAENPFEVLIPAKVGLPEGEEVAVPTATITNTPKQASLTVEKANEGGSAADLGLKEYPAELFCSYEGQPVESINPMKIVLSTEAPVTVDVPVGADCHVVETDSGLATSVEYSPGNDEGNGSGNVEIEADDENNIAVTNNFDSGKLTINKEIAGAGAADFGHGEFTFTTVCSVGTGDEAVEVFNATTNLSVEDGKVLASSEELGPILVGANCVVTETENGGGDYTPAPIEIVIEEGENQVAFAGENANKFSAGTIGLEKKLDGAAAGEPWATDATFDIKVTCEREVAAPENRSIWATVFSKVVTIKGGEKIDVLQDAEGNDVKLPLGTLCHAEETVAGGATSTTIDHDSRENAVVVENTSNELQALQIVATNTFDYGSLDLKKVVDGDAAGFVGDREFELAVTCQLPNGTDAPTAIDLGANAKVLIKGGQTVSLEQLPVGAECFAEETNTGGASTSVVSNDGADNAVVIGSGEENVAITATNTFDAGKLTVSKQVINEGNGPYTFSLVCTNEFGEIALNEDEATFSLKDGESKEISVPAGAECVVTETENGGATVSFVDSDDKHDGKVVVDQEASVVVVNTFAVTPPDGDGDGDGDEPGPDGDGGGDGDEPGPDGDKLPATGFALMGAGALGLLALATGLLLVRRRKIADGQRH